MQHFERAAAIKPSDFDSNFAIAVYRQRTGNLAEAIRRYQAVVDSPATMDMKQRALTYMSYAYRDLGDTVRERECLAEADRLRRNAPFHLLSPERWR